MCTKGLASYPLFVIITYLTNVWGLSITHAAGIVNIWKGITPTLTIVFASFADSRKNCYYHMLMLSSIAYSIGLGLLALSTPAFFGPCKEYKEECIGHIQKLLFFTALALISVGQAGHAASLPHFVAAQNVYRYIWDYDDGFEAAFKGIFGKSIVLLVAGLIGLSFIKSWSILFGIPAMCSLTATVLFLTGFRSYERNIQPDQGNPIKTALRVFGAAASRHFYQVQGPSSPKMYNDDDTRPTDRFSFLNKAAIKYSDQESATNWTLCTVREVEDTKTCILTVPMCLALIVIGLVSSLGPTYFIHQANNYHVDLKDKGQQDVQILRFLLFHVSSAIISMLHYSRDNAPRNGIAVAMLVSVLCCIIPPRHKTQGLDHGLLAKLYDMFPDLVPQFALLGVADGLVGIGFTRFLENQVPENLQRYMLYFKDSLLGFGSMASVLLVYLLGKVISEGNNNNPNWLYTVQYAMYICYGWLQDVVDFSVTFGWIPVLYGAAIFVICLILSCFACIMCGTDDNVESIALVPFMLFTIVGIMTVLYYILIFVKYLFFQESFHELTVLSTP